MANETIIHLDSCSKWYGHVLGVSEVSWKVRRGAIVGLLGPNGAGKSTLMKMLVGLLRPSRGGVSVFGALPFDSRETRERIGYCPEHENMYDELTALEVVTFMAELSGISRSQAKKDAKTALCEMGLEKSMDRRVKGFSKGMRQRTKLATCLVHRPELLILDEPLTGVDPIARNEIVERIRQVAAGGVTVVISSHVLYEIEALTEEIIVIYRGQVLAEGNIYAIRQLIDKHPHRIRVECERPRALGSQLASDDHVVRVGFERGAMVVETKNPDQCYQRIGELAVQKQLDVRSLTSPDNNLGAVFEYLTGGRGGFK